MCSYSLSVDGVGLASCHPYFTKCSETTRFMSLCTIYKLKISIQSKATADHSFGTEAITFRSLHLFSGSAATC